MAGSPAISAVDFGPRARREYPLPVRILRSSLRFARRKPLGAFGFTLVVLLLFSAVFAGVLAPYDPDKLDLKNRLVGTTWGGPHWLGTDKTGRDTLSRLLYGARISMKVGFGAVLISSTGALFIGVVSGYIGGAFDKTVQRFIDAWQAMPGLIILITFLGIARRNQSVDLVWAMVLSIGFLGIPGASRVFRSQVLTIKQAAYVEAARSLGATAPRIMWKCIVPNVFPIVMVSATTGLGGAILAEASLSFLGFGPAGKPSWGQMLSVEGREYMRVQPGLAIWPGLCIASAVFGFNIFGDALRDVLDPRLRGR
ncbi:MAG: ABC transporter permease [Dehalococcoidia bacterium]|nr:ABC transporter permease [Dehalococcoidia bacterium]